jgi:hypothetical protein
MMADDKRYVPITLSCDSTKGEMNRTLNAIAIPPNFGVGYA